METIELVSAHDKITKLNPDTIYDVLIIGGGPAGATAAVYCMRKGLNCAMVVKRPGGQVGETASVENYLGFRYIEGFDLVNKFREQIQQFAIAYEEGREIIAIQNKETIKVAELSDHSLCSAKTIIIASGCVWRKLGIPGETEFTGRGVGYCTTCDAPLFRNKSVLVVGGGNSGVEAAIELAKLVKSVKLLERGDKLKADQVLVKQLENLNNTSVVYNAELAEIRGDVTVENIVRRNRVTGEMTTEPMEGVFIEVGLVPNTGFVKDLLALNKIGEIIIDDRCRTSVEGIFAAGDVTSVPFNQIIIAAGEGAKAALSVYKYLMESAR